MPSRTCSGLRCNVLAVGSRYFPKSCTQNPTHSRPQTRHFEPKKRSAVPTHPALRPPGLGDASRSVTSNPYLRSCHAAPKPAHPPPTTTAVGALATFDEAEARSVSPVTGPALAHVVGSTTELRAHVSLRRLLNLLSHTYPRRLLCGPAHPEGAHAGAAGAWRIGFAADRTMCVWCVRAGIWLSRRRIGPSRGRRIQFSPEPKSRHPIPD